MNEILLEKTEYQKLDDFYRRVRDQVVHENELYNQRIIWLITIQGFLYATIGIILQAIVPIDNSERVYHVNQFILLICILSIVVALVANRLLSNARQSLNELGALWDIIASKNAAYEESGHYFPHVSGGTSPSGRFHFFLRSGNLPIIFVISWIIGGIMLLRNVNFL